MKELLAQHSGLAWALIGALALMAALILLFLGVRRRRGRRDRSITSPAQSRATGVKVAPAKVDPAVFIAAVQEAEMAGQQDRLPALYLSLAQCRIEAGESADAEELLRKSIRGAGGARHKQTHAKARLALGDLAHASGDPTTACEHWQIARALFHELKQHADHAAAEQRMLRNGCPTDWVLTDF